MKEALRGMWFRLDAAWAVLRGRPVIRGVVISHGEVDITRLGRSDLLISKGGIVDSQILTMGPVILRADKTSACGDNTGDVITDPATLSRDTHESL